MAQVMDGRNPDYDLAAFSPDRFSTLVSKAE